MEPITAPTPAPRMVRRAAHRMRWHLPLIAVTGLVASFAPLGATGAAHAASGQTEGLACALGSTAPGGATGHTPATPGTHPSFVLTATDGYVLTPDGNSIYDWGYANANGSFQEPGPVLCVHEGDTVTVTLRNTLPVDTSIVFQGITGVTADGAPSVPDVVDNSLTKVAPRNPASKPNAGQPGGEVTYSFVASKPGTFSYESGTDPQIQVQMGLSGVLVVRPAPSRTDLSAANPGDGTSSVISDAAIAATDAGSAVTGTNVPPNATVGTVTAGTSFVLDVNGIATAPALGQISSVTVTDMTYGDSHVYDDSALAAQGNNPALIDFSHFNSKHEYLHVLTEIDPDLHIALEGAQPTVWDANTAYAPGAAVTDHGRMFKATPPPGTPTTTAGSIPAKTPAEWSSLYDLTAYKARYWTINGRSFPDTIAPNYSAHLPSQPYGSLVHIQPESPPGTPTDSPIYNPWGALVRFVNVGPVNYPFHPHADHDHQLGVDGAPLINPDTAGKSQDTTIDHFGFVIAPGQTTEATFSWYDAQQWSADTNPIVVPIPDQQSRFEGAYWSGSPYLGVRQDLATGVTQYNQCGEMYHVAHSHALFQATNYGIPATGMLTMIRVDPPSNFPGYANCKDGS